MKRIVFFAWALMGATLPVVAVERPNVLMIVVDDLNDWIGCLHGQPSALTPNIDRLAARGTLFANAHCQAPLCNPSRTSVLSGLRPSTTGIYGLLPGPRAAPALKDWVMLPQYFERNGYFTASFGKVYHDGAIKPPDRAKEWTVWGPSPGEPVPPKKIVNTPSAMKVVDWGIHNVDEKEYADWKTADNATAQLAAAPQDKPFFIAAGFRMPHLPCFATQKWFDLYPEDELELPPVLHDDRKDVPDFAWYLHWKLPEVRLSWLEQNNQWRPLVRAYMASTSFMDSQVGRLLDGLKASGRDQNTIVVLWSDHGWHIGEKGISGKNSLWERSTHVPLIFAGPGIAAGAVCTQPAELLDIYPTLVTAAGLPAREGLEGHSLTPQLRDATAGRAWPAITTHNADNHTVRTARWRYIRYADNSEELYDMVNDRNEWTNLAGEARYAAVKAELAKSVPAVSAAPAPGSAQRTLVRDGAGWRWEGEPIRWEERVQ
ncbi:MAG: sulfatase [Verrucomicrobia bacterium]|nr:sulfatase [Verrucomicrobiota bacterium]